MPVVPAAGYPYSGVPTVDPTTSTPNNYQNIPSTPDDFGAFGGRQLSHLGETLAASGKELASTAIAIQEQTNTVKASDATSQYQDAETKILYGDPATGDTGFYGKSGKDAMDAAPLVRDQLLKLRTSLGAGLQNDRQRVLFDGETRHLQAQTLRAMGAHYVKEVDKYDTSTLKAKADNANTRVSQAVLRGDDAEAQAWVGQRMKSQIELLQKHGIASDANVQQVMQEARSDYITLKAETLAAGGDPESAIKIVQNNIDALHGDDGQKLLEKYRARAMALQSQKAWRSPAEGGGPVGGGGGGKDPGSNWGALGPTVVKEMQKRGASPEFIQAAIGHGLVEGGFHTEWQKAGGSEESYGHWQLNFGGGEGNVYKERYGEDRSSARQVQFLMERMEEAVPGITKTRDAEAAMDAITEKFERYTGHAPGQRRGALAAAQRILGDKAHELEPGAKPAASAPGTAESKEQSGNYTTSAWGDSIAAHSIRLGGTGGKEYNDAQKEDSTAVSGANPSNVHNLLEHGPEQHVKGQDVLLSTGASNIKGAGPMNEGNQDLIKDQIKTALQRGAKTVTVIGVGNAPFLAGRNEQLAAIVGSFRDPRVVFSGALNPNNLLSDGVHVKDKKAFVRDVIKVRDAGAPS